MDARIGEDLDIFRLQVGVGRSGKLNHGQQDG